MGEMMNGFPDDPDLTPIVPPQADKTPQSAVKTAATPTHHIVPLHREDWARVIDLKFPLLVDDVPLTQLTLRRLTGGDVVRLIQEIGEDRAALNQAARAVICGVRPAVLNALAADDAMDVMSAATPFLGSLILGEAAALLEDDAAHQD
jgi:hypothetical protein